MAAEIRLKRRAEHRLKHSDVERRALGVEHYAEFDALWCAIEEPVERPLHRPLSAGARHVDGNRAVRHVLVAASVEPAEDGAVVAVAEIGFDTRGAIELRQRRFSDPARAIAAAREPNRV